MVKRHIKHLRDPNDYETFQGLHPPLISEDIFTEVQRVRTERPSNAHVKEDFELQNAFAGLIFCAKCGKRIGRTVSNRGVPRFRCVNHRNCHTASYDYAKTEEQVISALRQWVKGYMVEIEKEKITGSQKAVQAQLDSLYERLPAHAVLWHREAGAPSSLP